MTSFDLFVGFRGKPNSLEAFLNEKGYACVKRDQDQVETYEPKSGDVYPTLYFFPEIIHDDMEEPIWEGHPGVTSELNVYYHAKESTEAEEIAELVTQKFKGVLYNPSLDEHFEGEDI